MKNYLTIFHTLIIATVLANMHSDLCAQSFLCSYNEALKIGMEKNFNIKLSRLDLEAIRGQAMAAGGQLNPYLDMKINTNSGKDPTFTYGPSKTFNTSLVLPTRYGIYYSTGLTFSRVTDLEPAAPSLLTSTSGLWVGANISLLRGSGRYNNLNIGILATDRYYSAKKAAFSDEVMRYIRDVTTTYVLFQKDIRVYKARLDDLNEATKYQKFIEELISHGELPSVEIKRAMAFAIGYQQKKTDAENQVINSLNKLYQLLGEGNQPVYKGVPECTENLPDPQQFPSSQIVSNILTNTDALIKRTPYYKSLEDASAGAQIEMKGAENLKRHQLDLDLRYYYYGTTVNQPARQFFHTFSSSTPGPSFNVTLSYRFPFQNQVSKGQYITKLADYQSRSTEAEKTKFEATTSVRNLIDNFRNLTNLFKYARQYADVQNRTYQDELKKFRLGTSNQLDIISAYETFAEARVNSYEFAYNIYYTTFQLKYLIGDLPKEQEELENTNLSKISLLNVPEVPR